MNIVIALVTCYPNTRCTRFLLAERLCKQAEQQQTPVAVVDGSPNPEVALRLQKSGAIVVPQHISGMGSARRQSYFLAQELCIRHGANIILATEPEKVPLLRSVAEVSEPIINDSAKIVIVGRTPSSWDTWPAFQQQTEKEANKKYAQATGLTGFDPMHGPVAFDLSVAHFFVSFMAKKFGVCDQYIHHYAPLVAMQAGVVVQSVLIDTEYPRQQREEEEGDLSKEMKEKRLSQLSNLSADYQKMATALGFRKT